MAQRLANAGEKTRLGTGRLGRHGRGVGWAAYLRYEPGGFGQPVSGDGRQPAGRFRAAQQSAQAGGDGRVGQISLALVTGGRGRRCAARANFFQKSLHQAGFTDARFTDHRRQPAGRVHVAIGVLQFAPGCLTADEGNGAGRGFGLDPRLRREWLDRRRGGWGQSSLLDSFVEFRGLVQRADAQLVIQYTHRLAVLAQG